MADRQANLLTTAELSCQFFYSRKTHALLRIFSVSHVVFLLIVMTSVFLLVLALLYKIRHYRLFVVYVNSFVIFCRPQV